MWIGGARVLAVDDDQAVLSLLGRLLERSGFRCRLVSTASEARAAMEEEAFDLALCDVQLAGESGLEVARHIVARYPDTAVVMVTGMDDPAVAREAMEIGTYGYVVKPFKSGELLIRLANALHRRHLEMENRLHRTLLEEMVQARTQALDATIERLRKTLDGAVQAMALTVEARDPYTAGHQRRVAELAEAMAREMGFSPHGVEGIRVAGTIHDLGKISVPAEILSKPGQISGIEFAIIQTHSRTGYEILRNIDFPWPVADMVLQHHERMDGSGYPSGLQGEALLPEARILCVADVVEAMSSHRPYRPALGLAAAAAEIRGKRGILYDPASADACVALLEQKGFTFS